MVFREKILRYFNESDALLLNYLKTGTTLSYKEALPETKYILFILHQNGIKGGERVAGLLDNSVHFFLLYLTCLLQRIIICPINPKHSREDVNYCVNLSMAKKIITNRSAGGVEIPVIKLDEFICPITEFDSVSRCLAKFYGVYSWPIKTYISYS